MYIKTVTIIGANGTMGANISGIFASFGNAKVYMAARDMEAAERACERAVASVKAEAIIKNLIPVSYDQLSKCIPESDFIMESVAEDMQAKRSVFQLINNWLSPNTIIATGTSGLSINELAEYISQDKRKYFYGVHFFNPPYNLTLCELVLSQYSDREKADELKEYLKSVLLRNVVEVKDTAAFMGNRMGFQFINLALQLAERYQFKGGIDFIDTIMGGFTGRAMPPLATADFVGLDVHKAIVDNVYRNIMDYEHESFEMPQFVNIMVKEHRLGRKVGEGLYKVVRHEDNSKEIYVFDIAFNAYRPQNNYSFPFINQMIGYLRRGEYIKAFRVLVDTKSEEARICIELLLRYTLYGIYISKEIGEDIHSADKVMASGFNWLPPLCVYHILDTVYGFEKLARETIPDDILNQIDIEELLSDVPETEYDYRTFIKAKG